MKVKLLKKIRKRFGWYMNVNNWPVLVDHYRKKAVVINLGYLSTYHNQSVDELNKTCEVSINELAWRCLKSKMTEAFGYSSLENYMYKIGKRNSNSRKKH